MARMIPASAQGLRPIAAEQAEGSFLLERLAGELDDGWQVVQDCETRNPAGTLDYVLLHRDAGVAVIGPAKPTDGADAKRCEAALRRVLGEIGFTRRFPGSLPVVVLQVAPDDRRPLGSILAEKFATLPRLAITDPGWTEWLVARLSPEVKAPSVTRSPAAQARLEPLRGPRHEESWRVRGSNASQPEASAAETVPAISVAPERIPRARDLDTRSPLWAGMGLAILVVAIVLVGMHALSNGNSARTPTAQLGAPATQEQR